MARTDPYLTVQEFKDRTKITGSSEDALIESAVKAASRQIENVTGRFFGQSDEVRYVTPTPWYAIPSGLGVAIATPEFVTLSEVAQDDGTGLFATVIDPGDYEYLPLDGATLGLPYVSVNLLNNWGWPTALHSVRLTGTFGWPAVPEDVKNATHLIANRLRALWTAPFGSTGAGEMGSGINMTGALTPLIQGILADYRVFAV